MKIKLSEISLKLPSGYMIYLDRAVGKLRNELRRDSLNGLQICLVLKDKDYEDEAAISVFIGLDPFFNSH